ncbi:MAG: hypothetical protein NTW87_33845 [Planctomycetota bacterium]|nr:hypothetical protein [Planctomycetota bacterium]
MAEAGRDQGRAEAGVPDPGRRGFWRQVLGHAVVACKEAHGQRHYSTADLSKLPDSVLAEVVPVFFEGCGYTVEDGYLFRTVARASRPCDAATSPARQRIYECSEQHYYILQRFGSGTNLTAIGRELAGRFEMSEEQGFRAVRALFLELAGRGCCHPAGVPEPPGRAHTQGMA